MSGVFCSSDAPLVNLHDICSGYSLEISDNGETSAGIEVGALNDMKSLQSSPQQTPCGVT